MAELASPLAGGIQAVRRSVPSSVFTGGAPAAPAQPDPITTNLIQQNSTALTSVSRQLSNISTRVSNLGNSLASIQNQLEVRASIERRREQARQNRERVLAEQGLREGKESIIETKIRTALFAPVQKIAAKTRGFLSRLADFLLALTTGWITSRTLQTIKAFSEGNKEKGIRLIAETALTLGTIVGVVSGVGLKVKLLGTAFALIRNTAFGAAASGLLVIGFQSLMKLLRRLSERVRSGIATLFPGIKKEENLENLENLEGGNKPESTSSSSTSEGFATNLATTDSSDTSDAIESSGTSDSKTITSDESGTGSGTGFGSSSSSGSGSSSGGGSTSTTSSGSSETGNKKSIKDRITDFIFGPKITEGDVSSGSIRSGAVFAGEIPNTSGGDNVSGEEKKDLSSNIKGINKKSDNNVAEKVSKDDDRSGFGINLASNQKETIDQDVQTGVSGSTSKGSVPLPIIPSFNESNNHVYTALKNYQITAN